jgi:putative oxidoreductase
MYRDHTALQIAGQLLIALLFLGTGARTATTQFRQHLERMIAYGVPRARLALIAGLAMQFAGGMLLALDLYRAFAAAILIAFTVLASAIFHRWWLAEDPLRRHFHISFLFSNGATIGALLLLM